MKWVTILLMKYALKLALKKNQKEQNSVLKTAYGHMIKNYKNTIMFLEAENH